jgi:hypothetical protein
LSEKQEVRFSKADLALLGVVAKKWRCSRADVIRRAVVELFTREGCMTAGESLAAMVEEARGTKR